MTMMQTWRQGPLQAGLGALEPRSQLPWSKAARTWSAPLTPLCHVVTAQEPLPGTLVMAMLCEPSSHQHWELNKHLDEMF